MMSVFAASGNGFSKRGGALCNCMPAFIAEVRWRVWALRVGEGENSFLQARSVGLFIFTAATFGESAGQQHQGHRAAFLAAMPVTMATPGSTPRGGDKVKEAWTAFMDAAEVGPSILAHA